MSGTAIDWGGGATPSHNFAGITGYKQVGTIVGHLYHLDAIERSKTADCILNLMWNKTALDFQELGVGCVQITARTYPELAT